MRSRIMPGRAGTALALLLLLVAAAACGQKPGVHGGTISTQGVGETGQVLVNPQTGEPLPGPEGGSVGAQGGAATGGGEQSSGGVATAGGTQARAGDTDGITPTEVKIGLHAPLTGAAAVPLVDIQRGTGIYSTWLKGKGGSIHGRHMTTIWRDDQYSPSEAVRQCADLVEKQKVFMLVGGAGTDQILACARYAASKGVPYLSAGVTENVVKSLNNYFAVSMSYPQQGRLLAEMIYKFDAGPQGGKVFADRCDDTAAAAAGDPFCRQLGSGPPKVAIVYSNTDGFYDGRDAFLREWKQVSGKDVDQTYSITKFNIAAGESNSLVQRLKQGGFDVVYVLTSPTNWLSILRVSEGQQYAPRWVGVGLTMGINTVATTACGQSGNSFANSLFLNPWFSVDSPNSRQFGEGWGGDYKDHDIAFGLWGISIAEHAMLEKVGKDITRSKFISQIGEAKGLKAPDTTKVGEILDVFTQLSFSPKNHMGGNQAHLLYGACPEGRWLDVPGKQFVSGF